MSAHMYRILTNSRPKSGHELGKSYLSTNRCVRAIFSSVLDALNTRSVSEVKCLINLFT